MRIGIYDPYLDDLGGGEKYMMTAAVCLSKKHDVSVFWDKVEDLKMLEERFSLDFNNVSLTRNIFSKKVSFWTRLTESKKYDAVIFLSDGSIPFVLSKKLFIHLQQPLEYISTSSFKDKLKLSRVTSFFCNSEYTRSFNAGKLGKTKTIVVYPPVELQAKLEKKENIILNVGRFRVINIRNEDYKKQQLMVDVFKKMIDSGLTGWKLVIATSVNDENDPKFREMIESGSGFPIEFVVNRNNNQLWEIYNKAKIYWHASGFGEDLEAYPEYAEHFGISTVEAMGAGAVPVVINAGGQKEIVTDKKNGFLWESLEELKEQTLKLISDERLWKKISDSARLRAKDFSKEKFCGEIEKLLK